MISCLKINLVCFSWIFLACPSYGQAEKPKQLLPEDYAKWSSLYDLKISDKGNWCSYRLSYESGKDTLYAKSTLHERTYAISQGNDGVFNGDEWFGCLADNKFMLLNLETGKRNSFDNATSFTFAGNGHFVLIYTDNDGKQELIVRNLAKGDEMRISGADWYAVSPDSKFVAVAVTEKANAKVVVVPLGEIALTDTVITSAKENYSTIVWQDSSASFAFAGFPNQSKQACSIWLYRLTQKKLFGLDTRTAANWERDRFPSCNTNSSIAISRDGKRVFFTAIKKPTDKPSKDAVEIWNAQDKDLWHYRMRGWNNSGKEAVWTPETGVFSIIGTDGQITGKTSADQKYMLTYDTTPYKPSVKQVPDRDIYITNLVSGEMSLLLKKQFGEYGEMNMSPDGRFVCYFKENSWWSYDTFEKKHRDLTSNIVTGFSEPYFQTPMVPIPFGLAAWTNEGKSVLLYDAYDIWEVSLEGKLARRLTKGREEKIVYRISEAMFSDSNTSSVKFARSQIIDGRKDIIIEGNKTDGSSSGFYCLSLMGKIRCFFRNTGQNSKAVLSKNGQLAFISEDYSRPPKITTVHIATANSRIVYQSNPQHHLYNWGKSELLNFRNERGEKRTAVLFYPFNYDPAKQYPMVVKVYEDLMYTLHKYVNPSLQNGDGYNTTTFTGNGYFVLHPNIVYENGDRGLSATKCIVEAVDAAIGHAPIDKKGIGLIGHSFGGYETFFTVTQTNIFAAAVAGAGVSDITASYLSMGWNFSRPETWRFEYDQGGMGKSLFDSPGSYRDNSGITYADRVTTPLLSWTGANDPEVDPSQSMEFYMALRRLGKEHIMLRYPDEGHSLLKPENEFDLSTRIMQWFDHYLKGKEKPDWCNSQ